MVNFEPKPTYNVEDLRQIVALLRAPGGCPWDGAQTHESLRRNFIEEAYEVAEAIDEASPAHLKEELGIAHLLVCIGIKAMIAECESSVKHSILECSAEQ